MEHNGGGRFALSYMRHTDKWFRLFPSLSVDECLDPSRMIRGFKWFEGNIDAQS